MPAQQDFTALKTDKTGREVDDKCLDINRAKNIAVMYQYI